jgi:hypothetical protein
VTEKVEETIWVEFRELSEHAAGYQAFCEWIFQVVEVGDDVGRSCFDFVFLLVKSMLTGVGGTVPWNKGGSPECSRESILRSNF